MALPAENDDSIARLVADGIAVRPNDRVLISDRCVAGADSPPVSHRGTNYSSSSIMSNIERPCLSATMSADSSVDEASLTEGASSGEASPDDASP